jgi:Ca2+-binding RTX toxin-like protein
MINTLIPSIIFNPNLPILPNVDLTDFVDPTSSYGDESKTFLDDQLSPDFFGAGDFGYVLVGDERANTIMTGLGPDLIHAGAGDDVVYGGGYADTIQGGSGDDQIFGQHGVDTIYGGAGSDILFGGNTIDSASGYMVDTSGDQLFGGSGNDVLHGGAGGDALNGGLGSDTASYRYALAGVSVNMKAPAGNTGHAAGDTYVSIENLTGSNFADVFFGNDGANVFNGRGGDDTLAGGLGKDTYWLGDGADTIRLLSVGASTAASEGRDLVMDWSAADRIDVGAIDANDALAGNQAFVIDAGGSFAAGEIRFLQAGGQTHVFFNTDADSAAELGISLQGLHTLTNANFVF